MSGRRDARSRTPRGQWLILLLLAAATTLPSAALVGASPRTGAPPREAGPAPSLPLARPLAPGSGSSERGIPRSTPDTGSSERAYQGHDAARPGDSRAWAVSTVDVGSQPASVTYDPDDGDLYVSNNNASTLTVINGTQVVGTVEVGGGPADAAFDPADGNVYVPNERSDNVSILSGTTVVGGVAVGLNPVVAVYDPNDSDVYVVNGGSLFDDAPSDVSVLHGTKLLATIDVGYFPGYAAVDPTDGYVYVCNVGSSSVSVISGTKVIGTVGVGSNPYQPAFDPSNGFVYVPAWQSDNVSVINGTSVVTTRSVPGAQSAAYDPSDGWIYVPGGPGSFGLVSVINGTANASTIDVGGLPLSATYGDRGGYMFVTLLGTNGSIAVLQGADRVATIPVGSEPQASTYDPGNGYLYVPNAYSNNVSVIRPCRCANFTVTFTESGLYPNASWSVTLDDLTRNSTGPTLEFGEPNGTYSFAVGGEPGWTTAPFTGSISVNGTNLSVPVDWVIVAYPLTFREVGLPPGVRWSVALGSDDTSGQPTMNSSRSAGITFLWPNGSLSYTVGYVPGFLAIPFTGTVTVDGSGLTISVPFSPVYAVTFVETGLPSGRSWSVSFNGSKQSGNGGDACTAQGDCSSTSARIEVSNVTDGTYGFQVRPIAGYSGSPGSGSITVDGGNATVRLTFRSDASAPTFLGRPRTEGYALGILVAAATAGLVLLGWRSRHGRAPRARGTGDGSGDAGASP